MLVLTRRPHQQIMLGDEITINIVDVNGENVRIAIDAPRHVKIFRGWFYREMKDEKRTAAAAPMDCDLTKSLPVK